MIINDKIKNSFKGMPCGIVWYYVYNKDNAPTLKHTAMFTSSIDDEVKIIRSMKSFIAFVLDKKDIQFKLVENGFKEIQLIKHGIK